MYVGSFAALNNFISKHFNVSEENLRLSRVLETKSILKKIYSNDIHIPQELNSVFCLNEMFFRTISCVQRITSKHDIKIPIEGYTKVYFKTVLDNDSTLLFTNNTSIGTKAWMFNCEELEILLTISATKNNLGLVTDVCFVKKNYFLHSIKIEHIGRVQTRNNIPDIDFNVFDQIKIYESQVELFLPDIKFKFILQFYRSKKTEKNQT